MATVSRTVTGIQIPVTEKYYKEVIEGASSYNARLCSERRLRLPFLDSQTGVAQNHTNLWVQHRFRTQGDGPGQLYTYPAKRWKKKKRTVPIGGELPVVKAAEVETVEATPYMHNISAVENPAVVEVPLPPETKDLSAWKDEYYDEWENLSEPPDAGEIDDRNSDSSDFEQTYIKKRKKKATKKTVEKKPSGGRGRRSGRGQDLGEVDEVEKPYGCDRSSKKEKNKEVSKYCDFCLGDETENKKTGQKEELVSCADCGRSGHPSCLQFTANMIISVKKYPWQCIECKSCGLCGTSDNDDQLLFCDDCDRGYHMYCLNPPLSEPPEGSWSCHLCIVEFYDGKKPDNGQV